jgi:hypothetical protein
MMSSIRKRLTYANVVATLALFLAIGGVSYAAIKLPKNSVGTKQLKNGAVTGKKLAPAAVKSLGTPGPQGPIGPAGATGPQGSPGEPGSALGYAKVGYNAELDSANSKGVLAVVPACQPHETNGCGAPPESVDFENNAQEYCFKLSFQPHVVTATPIIGVIYNHETPIFDAEIPARGYGEIRGGCPEGYRDAEVEMVLQGGRQPVWGFYAVFD